jgi:predicted dehydrogenase
MKDSKLSECTGFHTQSCSRRTWLGTLAAGTAATTLPAWFLDELQGAPQQDRTANGANEHAIALIGCGGRGRGIAQQAASHGRIVALCDVDERQLAQARKTWPEASAEKDFRRVLEQKDVDIVVCGTVDHWHVLVSAAAMRAGKDVYCEKPLTLTIDEGKHLVRTQQETGRILQTGSQQRSDAKFRLACELVRNGRLGKLQHIDVFLPSGRREGPFPSATVPDGFDWDLWQGPTPQVDYVPERTHVTFRYWWEYSGGTMTDWGAHHNDIALWGLGLERSGPITVRGKPLVEMIPGGFTAASEYEVQYTYANGVTHSCRSTSANAWNGAVLDPQGQQHGVKFIGSEGWIWVTRGQIQASDPEILVEPLDGNATRLPVSNDHMGNFFESVGSRRPPVCDAEIGHRSASICHLGVIALRLGRELKWDPGSESFSDAEANGWRKREMRAPWSLDT